MRSMTGFGSGSGNDGKLAVTIEMRAVNQRFLELNIRMPHAYLALEDRLRSDQWNFKCARNPGKVDVFVTVQDLDPAAPDVRVDHAALGAVKTALQDVNDRFFDGKVVTLGDVTSLTKDWFVQTPPAIDADASWPPFAAALQGALDSMVAMREREGANISRDLLDRADKMAALVESIASRKAVIVQAYEERLEKKILSLMDKAQAAVPDEDRLLQEVAIYSDKVDFTEEVVRFRSHLNQLHTMLQSPGEVGRKLDFLIQEMNRETNTIGSKAGDLAVTEAVLQLKNEIEKIREQVQNIE